MKKVSSVRRVLAVLLTVLLVTAVLAGCGQKEEEKPAEEVAEEATIEAEEEEAAEETEAAGEEAAEAAAEETAEPAEEAAGEAEVAEEAGEEATEEMAGVADFTEDETAEGVTVRVAALKGPTAMGMVKIMSDAENGVYGEGAYDFTLAAAPDEVAPLLIQGKIDIAAVPANLAATLYNKTEGKIRVIAVNTLGVLYIVEKGDSVQTVADLAGKTIYASGQGATPEYALNYILRENGLDPEQDVTIEWKSEHAECLSALTQDENGIALLPQPFVTTAMGKVEGLRVALDLTEEWDHLQEDAEEPSRMITGATVCTKAFAEEHPDLLAEFMERYADSVAYVNGNVSEAAALIEHFDIIPAAVAEKAIPACKIVCIGGPDLKEVVPGYLAVLAEANPQAVGGALPADDFYYTGE